MCSIVTPHHDLHNAINQSQQCNTPASALPLGSQLWPYSTVETKPAIDSIDTEVDLRMQLDDLTMDNNS